jgi:hypothetical protein
MKVSRILREHEDVFYTHTSMIGELRNRAELECWGASEEEIEDMYWELAL